MSPINKVEKLRFYEIKFVIIFKFYCSFHLNVKLSLKMNFDLFFQMMNASELYLFVTLMISFQFFFFAVGANGSGKTNFFHGKKSPFFLRILLNLLTTI